MLRSARGRSAGRSELGRAWREPEPARADGCDERPANRPSASERRSATSSSMSCFHHFGRDHGLVKSLRLTLLTRRDHPRIVARQYLREAPAGRMPISQQRPGNIGISLLAMLHDQLAKEFKIGLSRYQRVDHLGVQSRRIEVEEVTDAA